MVDGGSLQLDPASEQAKGQDAAAKLAGDANDTALLSDISIGIKNLSLDMGDHLAGLADDVIGVGVAVGGLVSDMVSKVTDPIKKGLDLISSDLKGGMSNATLAGMVVGAVYTLKDELIERFTWLWDNWDVALDEVGTFISDAFAEAWGFLKEYWPEIKEGLLDLAQHVGAVLEKGWDLLKGLGGMIWDQLPPWLQTAFGVIGDVGSFILQIPVKIARYISEGLADVFEGGTFGDLLEGVSMMLDWVVGKLGGETRAARTEREAKEMLERSDKAFFQDMEDRGATEEKIAYTRVIKAGTDAHAKVATTWVANNREVGYAAITKYLDDIKAGASPSEAFKSANKWFSEMNKAQREGKAVAGPVSSAGQAGEVGVSPEVVASAKAQNEMLTESRKQSMALDRLAAATERKANATTPSMDEVNANNEVLRFGMG